MLHQVCGFIGFHFHSLGFYGVIKQSNMVITFVENRSGNVNIISRQKWIVWLDPWSIFWLIECNFLLFSDILSVVAIKIVNKHIKKYSLNRPIFLKFTSLCQKFQTLFIFAIYSNKFVLFIFCPSPKPNNYCPLLKLYDFSVPAI